VDFSTMITVKEAAKRTGYTPQNITHMIRKGKLGVAVRRGRKYFIPEVEVSKLIKVMGSEAEPQLI